MVRHYEGSAILTEALRRSIKPLMIPLFFLVLMTFAFAGTIYYTEGVVGGNPNPNANPNPNPNPNPSPKQVTPTSTTFSRRRGSYSLRSLPSATATSPLRARRGR